MENTQIQVKRRELKYYINKSDYEYLKVTLDNLMTRDKYCVENDGYFIRSLYFDDIHDGAVQEKLAGEENRAKYRLRIYYLDQDWVKLERKRKYNDYVQKDTGILTIEQTKELIDGNYKVLLEPNKPILNSIYYDFSKRYMKPVVIIDYIRDVYLMDFNQIRVTFDKKIRRDEKNLDLFSTKLNTEPVQRDEVIVLEVKYNDFLPPWFEDLIQPRGQVRSAISKYCMGRIKEDNYWVQ